MRIIAVPLVLALVTGCASKKPLVLTSIVPLPLEVTISCASRQVNQLGYTIKQTDTARGYLLAEKLTKSHMLGSIGGNSRYDLLKVSVSGADSATRKMEVTAASEREDVTPMAVRRSPIRPSDQVQTDGGKVLSACNEVRKATGAVP
jgi:hypothetical protein